MSKQNISLYDIFAILLVPAALFWILYRYGFLSIIDALAVGILAGAGILYGMRYLFNRKIFSFKK